MKIFPHMLAYVGFFFVPLYAEMKGYGSKA